jgi:hypothetical protein
MMRLKRRRKKMVKAAPFFFLGFLAGLVFVELTNGKPAVKTKQSLMNEHPLPNSNNPMYPIEDSNQSDAQDTFNSQRSNETPPLN